MRVQDTPEFRQLEFNLTESLTLAMKSRFSQNYPASISVQNRKQISKKTAAYWSKGERTVLKN